MKEYRVQWTIDIDASSPEEAAREALAIQRDPASIATVFTISTKDAFEVTTVDLGFGPDLSPQVSK